MTSVKHASEYWVRLLEHVDRGKKTVLSSDYVSLCLQLSVYFSKKSNKTKCGKFSRQRKEIRIVSAHLESSLNYLKFQVASGESTEKMYFFVLTPIPTVPMIMSFQDFSLSMMFVPLKIHNIVLTGG